MRSRSVKAVAAGLLSAAALSGVLLTTASPASAAGSCSEATAQGQDLVRQAGMEPYGYWREVAQQLEEIYLSSNGELSYRALQARDELYRLC